jgi:hypothetical protein
VKNCKYIVVDNEHIYLFPMHINHIDMYRNVKHAHLDRGQSGSWPCTGAGFVLFKIKDGCIVGECYGESISLGIPSNPEFDSILLTRLLGGY